MTIDEWLGTWRKGYTLTMMHVNQLVSDKREGTRLGIIEDVGPAGILVRVNPAFDLRVLHPWPHFPYVFVQDEEWEW